VNSSTVVRRTDAGKHELAVPAHGLSLAQRRFLTLLDTPCTVGTLAMRYTTDGGKLTRDLMRLVQLGLVAWDPPVPANDPTGPGTFAGESALRPAPRDRVRRAALALVPVGAAALAWVAWTHLAATAPPGARSRASPPSRVAPATVHDTPAPDPLPIATRVLKGAPLSRARDATKPAN